MNKSQRSSKSPKKFRSNSLFPVMSTIPEGSSPTSKISNFFRRHRKSTNFSTEDENEVMSSSEMGGDVGGSNENLEKVNKKKEEFGNYNTVSGTGANLLRDVFNKKYRSSMKPSKSKLKKESIKEEESSEASNTLTASVGKKLHHDMHRSRHTSISYDSKRSFMPSIRGIFESFRSRSNRDSFSDVNQFANNSSTSPTSNPIPHTIVYAPGKKKKKFKVTRALEDEPNKFGFNSYLELYRKNQLDARPHHEQRPHHFSKASTIHAFEPMQIIIWKDKKRGTRVFKLPKSYTDSLEFEKSHGETIDSEELAMTRFSNSQSCYDLMPPSAKLIIFDIDLNVKKAFFALLQNGIKSAPIWSNQKHDYVGLLTVTDFLKIIKEYYHCSELDMKELEDQKISLWKTRLQDTEKPLRWVAPDTSLLAAISLMSRHHISHLPVVQYGNGNILYVLTAKRVLKYLASFMKTMIKDPNKEDNGNNYLQQSILHSEICSQQELYYATLKTPLIKVIDLFLEKGVSSLPVVVDDVSKKVVDVYTKADVLSIANDQMIDSLSTPIGEVLQKRQSSNQLQTCSINERLCDVINRIVQAAVHVIVVVSDRKELKRVISVSDLLSFIVLKPFYKYKDIMEKKRLKVQLLTESLHTQQQQRNLAPLPTLQENSTVEGSSFQQNIALQHQDPKPSTLEALFKAESTYVEKQLTEQPTATTTTTLLSTTTQLTTTTIQPTTKNTLLPNTTTATHSSSTIVATQQQPPTSTTQTTSSPQQPPSSSAPQEVKKMKFKKAETSINNNKKNKIGNKKKNNKNKDVNTNNNNNNNTAAVNNNNNNNSTTTTTTTATTTTATDNNGAKARATTAEKSDDVTNRANNFTNQCNNNNEPVGEIEKSINEGTSGFDQITNNNNKNNSNKNNGNNNNNESSTLSKNPADKTSVETNNNNSIGTTAITTETNTLAMDNNNNNNDNNNNNINAATVATTSTTNDDKNDLTQVTTGTADDNDTDNNNNNIDNNNNADVVKDNRDTDVFNDKVGVGDAVDKKSGNNNSNNKNNSENNKNESQSNSSSVNNNNNSKTNKTKKVKKVVKKSTSSNKPS